MSRDVHEMDEWHALQEKSVEAGPYRNPNGRLRITRCQLTFKGYDDLELVLRKSRKKTGGMSLKFAERGGKRKTKWLWLWEHFTNEEAKMIANFLAGQTKEQNDIR